MSMTRFFRRRATMLLPLVPMLTFQILPIVSLAQQTPQNSPSTEKVDKNERSDTGKPNDKEPTDRNGQKKPIPPPGNPLVIIDPATGTGNNPKAFDKRGNRTPEQYMRRPDFGNHRESPRDVRDDTESKRKKEDLPYFGYSYFEPLRQIILARRSYYQSLYSVDNTNSRRAGTNSRPYGPVSREGRDSMSNTPQSKTGTATGQGKVRYDKDGYPISDVPNRAKPGEIIAPAYGEKRTERRRTNREGDTTGADPQLMRRRSTNPADPEYDRYADEYDDGMLRDEEDYAYPIDPDAVGSEMEARRRRTLRDQDLDPLYFNQRQARPIPLDEDYYDQRLTTRERMLQDTARSNAAQRDMTLSSIQGAPRSRTRTNDENSTLNAYTNIADPLSQIFRNVSATAPTSYQLAPGDKLEIRYSTAVMPSKVNNVTVDMQGVVDIEGMGRVTVRGMTPDQAEKAIAQQLKKLYKNPTVAVKLRELRTITVNAGGEIFEPGPYTLPAVATAFNLLQAAGGPTYDGSLRNIEVYRNGKIIAHLDFYLIEMNKVKKDDPGYNLRLQDGDTVNVPSRESTIALTGEVRKAAIFELKEGETLADLLRYSGGVKPSGVSQSVQVNTVNPGQARVLKTVDIKKPGETQSFKLYDGDSIDVFSVRQTVINKVTVEGAVESPGDYAISEGMTIADLLASRTGSAQ